MEPWLNGDSTSPNAARSDWVNHTFTGGGGKRGDGDSVSFGCALAFLYYLLTQLQFSEPEIIGAGSSTLAGTYAKLTADKGNPFPAFLNLIEHVHPASSTVHLSGTVPDDMFPIAITSFWANKDTFGKAEVQDIIKNHGGVWPQAFWVVVDGFSEASFNALGVTVEPFTGSFANLSGIEIIPNLAIDYENAASPSAPQRIRIPFDIKFTSAALPHFPGSGSTQYRPGYLPVRGRHARRRVGHVDQVRAHRGRRPVLHQHRHHARGPEPEQRVLPEPGPARLHRDTGHEQRSRPRAARRSALTASPAPTPTCRNCSPT